MNLNGFVICFTTLIQLINGNPKVGTGDDVQLNLGWPNFFSPKQAILGEKDSSELVSPFQTDELDMEEQRILEEENLIDYTIKGGLRGTYYTLHNSTSINKNLSEEALADIEHILKADEELFNAVDQKLKQGEVTDTGVRLKTPLIIKTVSNNLGKYGAKLTYADGNKTSSLIHFGNWCGQGGRSAPVDNIDNCCLEQQKCYGRIIKQCPDVWNKPYQYMYAWAVMDDELVCVRSEYGCVNYVCDCDREIAECLKYFVNHPREVANQHSPSNLNYNEDNSEEQNEEDEVTSDEDFELE